MASFKENFKSTSLAHRLLCLYGLYLIVTAIHIFYETFLYGDGGGDGAGYYIPLAEKVAQGYHIHQDLHNTYTPLGIILMGWVYRLFQGVSETSLSIHYLTLYSVHLLSAIAIVFILKKLKISYAIICFSLGAYFHLIITYRGTQIFLEPFVVLFALSALTFYFYMNQKSLIHWALIGLTSALALLSKQFGLSLLPFFICLFFIEHDEPKQTRSFLLCCLAGILSILCLRYNLGILPWTFSLPCLLAIFLWIENPSLKQILLQKYPALSFIFGYTFCLLGMMFYLDLNPFEFYQAYFETDYMRWSKVSSHKFNALFKDQFYLFCIIAMGFLSRKYHQLSMRKFILLGCAFLPFLSVRQYDHYFLLILPFLILTFALALDVLRQNHPALFVLGFFFMLLAHPHLTNSRWHKVNPVERHEKLEIGKDIRMVLDDHEQALILGEPSLYYFSETSPVLLKQYSYSFLDNHRIADLYNMLSHAKVYIVDPSHDYYHHYFSDSNVEKEFLNSLHQTFHLHHTTPFGLEIWLRKL